MENSTAAKSDLGANLNIEIPVAKLSKRLSAG